jgi:hypothetical protein
MPSYNGLHRNQLFHWIGKHVDEKIQGPKKALTSDARHEYLNCLRGALQSGLWVSKPSVPDYLDDGSLIQVHRPIACFTEWSFGESLPHTSRYGRMGFGFSKQFVMKRGGQPVTYIKDSSLAPYAKALKDIASQIESLSVTDGLSERQLAALKENFDYVAHFSKKIKEPVVRRSPPVAKSESSSVSSVSSIRRTTDPFRRAFGTLMPYLEEREWRIVYHKAIHKYLSPGPEGADRPQHYLHFKPGSELFTLVLPDNETVNLAMRDQEILSKLYPSDAPHVTVLSLDDIGTF